MGTVLPRSGTSAVVEEGKHAASVRLAAFKHRERESGAAKCGLMLRAAGVRVQVPDWVK